MSESRSFKVGNELANLSRPNWYYDTNNVAVKLGLSVSGELPDRVRIEAKDVFDI